MRRHTLSRWLRLPDLVVDSEPACCVRPVSPAEVRSLWAQLRRDEPHLLSNFEDFLARVTSQIIEANQEKSEMESALKRSGVAGGGGVVVYLLSVGFNFPFTALVKRCLFRLATSSARWGVRGLILPLTNKEN